MASSDKTISPTVVKRTAIEATPESFKEFGQVIEVSGDGEEFGPKDAQLDISRGIPRFYIMRLETRPLTFDSITHHANVTQCLGSVGGHVWYLGIAKGSIVDPEKKVPQEDQEVVHSKCGHYYVPPHPDDVLVFRITGPKFLKLNIGTWHAGPLFKSETMEFYNLELSNTNVVDHTKYYFKDGVTFVIDD
ncbi:uncharacterized protein LOC122653096 [Telopea speciosissima]|uniref:uncharacterized protein LOC122653096 n=1 Tax=Telopea speciosissima TaxID=54955 RepID=UPI001CC34C1A|nr:uncharacterized protein LOC122653096 [Telopea speciosissima]